MNLHNIISHEPLWFWCKIYGRNYAPMGVHFWQVERGSPPELETDIPVWRYTTPARYTWQPYATTTASMPVPRALCGYRTQAAHPRLEIETAVYYRHCVSCARLARTRGILSGQLPDIIERDSQVRALRAEWTAWSEARRLQR